MLDHEKLVKEASTRGKLHKTDDSEQVLLQTYIKTKKFSALKIRELDQYLFPYGKIFFETMEVQRHKVTPVVVHNNYIQGIGRKVERFKQQKLWALDAAGKQCAEGFLKSR